MAANPEGVVSIHGKQYKTVAYRINEFRERHPDYSIVTELVSADDERVVVKAAVLNNGTTLATGYAEEVRASSNINRTSAIENAETSAVGRALAFFGLAGTEIASADEVAQAINQQKGLEIADRLIRHNEAWKKHEESIHAIKQFIRDDKLDAALEALMEIPEEDLRYLRVAPTKGGWMTLDEQKAIKAAQEGDFDKETGTYQTWRTKKE